MRRVTPEGGGGGVKGPQTSLTKSNDAAVTAVLKNTAEPRQKIVCVPPPSDNHSLTVLWQESCRLYLQG